MVFGEKGPDTRVSGIGYRVSGVWGSVWGYWVSGIRFFGSPTLVKKKKKHTHTHTVAEPAAGEPAEPAGESAGEQAEPAGEPAAAGAAGEPAEPAGEPAGEQAEPTGAPTDLPAEAASSGRVFFTPVLTVKCYVYGISTYKQHASTQVVKVYLRILNQWGSFGCGYSVKVGGGDAKDFFEEERPDTPHFWGIGYQLFGGPGRLLHFFILTYICLCSN